MVEFHPGVAEIACVNVSILQDEALERVEYFSVAAVPNGMAGTPVGGDSCEVAIIDVNGMLICNSPLDCSPICAVGNMYINTCTNHEYGAQVRVNHGRKMTQL